MLWHQKRTPKWQIAGEACWHVGRELYPCSVAAVAERLVRPSGDAPGDWRHHEREGETACPWRMLPCADPCQEHTVRLWSSAENRTAWVGFVSSQIRLISNPWRLIKSDENQVFSSLVEIKLCLRWSGRCTCYSGTNLRSHTKSDKETTPGIKSLIHG